MEKRLTMRAVCISDTHNNEFKLPDGDILIHAGDLTKRGYRVEVYRQLNWLHEQTQFKDILVVPGNHDIYFERHPEQSKADVEAAGNITYLNDSGVEINGVKFWGSPVTPIYHDWAFNRGVGEIKKHWDMIPSNTDFLITHGPPFTILDNLMGCEHLLNAVERIQPKYHVFGHVHEKYGKMTRWNTEFFNVCSSGKFGALNEPVVIDF